MSGIRFSDAPFALKLPSPAEMAAYDQATIASGITSEALVSRAGKALFSKISDLLRDQFTSLGVTILCGPGNNGADGLVVARHLVEAGKPVYVFAPEYTNLSSDAASQMKLLIASGGKILRPDSARIRAALERSKVVVDAILGTGQRSAPEGMVAELLTAYLSESERPGKRSTVALDIPTGVNAATGEVYNPAFRADITVTVELVKRGMVQFPAREYCGAIHAVSIGIDCAGPSEYAAFDGAREKLIPARRGDAHKGSFGRVVVVGGSSAMPGAPTLAAFAALRCGAGLVRKAELAGALSEGEHPELLLRPVSATTHFQPATLAELEPDLAEADSVIVGPGIGLHQETGAFVVKLCEFCAHNDLPLVIDADALTLLKENIEQGKVSLASAILTPHPGEAARLLSVSTVEVQRDRYAAAKALQEKTQGVVVLKGAGTISRTWGLGYVNINGNPFMATAGSGDVLSGVIAALAALKLPLHEAAACAAWVHGKAGDIAHAKLKGPIVASDITLALPEALSECTQIPAWQT